MPSIYKTPDGAILKNPDGKIIKQPYEFGYAFNNKIGLNSYIKIQSLDLPMIPSTEVIFVYDNNLTSYANIVTRKTLDNNNYNLLAVNNNLVLARNSEAGSSYEFVLFANTGYVQSGRNIISTAIVSNVVSYSCCNSKFSPVSAPAYINHALRCTSIMIGAIKTAITNDLTPLRYSTEKINRYSLFSRALTKDELVYVGNNGLANNFQSRFLIEIDILFNNAEILDFSPFQNGSDMRVGCRDYSGYNRHGEIMNLPAGTIQQKLDFANANLFVPFQ